MLAACSRCSTSWLLLHILGSLSRHSRSCSASAVAYLLTVAAVVELATVQQRQLQGYGRIRARLGCWRSSSSPSRPRLKAYRCRVIVDRRQHQQACGWEEAPAPRWLSCRPRLVPWAAAAAAGGASGVRCDS